MRKTTSKRKVARRRQRSFKRRMLEGLWFLIQQPAVIVVLLLLVAGVWFYISGRWERTEEKLERFRYDTYARLGLVLKDVYLEGQDHTSTEVILKALDARIGEPIFSLPLWEMKGRLESLEWVRHAIVERQWPSTLHVRIMERVPAAIWQHEGKLELIDMEGKIIREANVKAFSNYIILVGEDALSYAVALFRLQALDTELWKEVSSAIRVSERRWNIRLRSGVEIKLPEEDIEGSWKRLVRIHQENNLLDGRIEMVDVRIPDKIYIKRRD